MAILIVVETGAGLSDSNAFVSVSDARTYATNRGIALPADSDQVAAMLIQATDYIESKSCQFGGVPTIDTQALCWPRKGWYPKGSDTPFPDDAIPKNLVSAQCALVIAVSQGISLLPNTSAADYVTEETVGPITTKYADPIAVGVTPNLGAADALLAPLFGYCGQGGIRSHRV